MKKPIMATRDLRFFDVAAPHLLPDGRPRRGMSVVAALSYRLVHTNRRPDGSWTQRYEHGIPATGLVPVAANGTTGTTVHFRPHQNLGVAVRPLASTVQQWIGSWSRLSVETNDRREDHGRAAARRR